MRRYRSTFKPRSLRRIESKSRNRIILAIIVVCFLLYSAVNWGLPALIGGLSQINKIKPKPSVVRETTGDAVAPPVLNIPFEATNSATLVITGYASSNAKIEIYMDDELKTAIESDSSGGFITSPLSLSVGTNNIYGITRVGDSKSLPSKNIRLLYNNEKPELQVTEPPDNHEVKGGDKKVRVSGKTGTDNSVMINGSTLILNGDGSFFNEVSLNEGDNTITIVATNQYHNTTSVEKKVKYTP